MHDVALSVGQDLARLEAKGGFQPLERGAVISVGEGGYEGRSRGRSRCDDILLTVISTDNI
jgi:hypothetical protein